MSVAAERYYSEEEYLELERAATSKSEYINGQIYAMAGGTAEHSSIGSNLLASVLTQLRGTGCRPYNSDMRVRVSKTRLDTYPDVSVVCGPAEFLDAKRDTLLNPTVIAEVLSPSTERFDRGVKFEHYQRLDSLREYLLVAQTHPRVDRYTRNPDDTWLLTIYEGLDAEVSLASVTCTLRLSEVYEEVDFPPASIRLPIFESETSTIDPDEI